MGGEPTFVVDRRHATAPSGTPRRVGPHKRGLADDLITPAAGAVRAGRPAALRPGQVVSRASSCRAGRSRSTGAATASRCGATPPWSPTRSRRGGATMAHAERFMLGLTERLGLEPDNAMPAYEDPAYFVLKEHMLPANVDPRRQQARRPDGAAAAGAGVRRGLDVAVGLRAADPALAGARRRPLAQRALADAARPPVPDPGRLAGRLPAAAGVAALGRAATTTRTSSRCDPFAAHAALPAPTPQQQPRRQPAAPAAATPPADTGVAGDGPHGAGRRAARRPDLHVFLPPLESAEDYRRAGRGDRGHRGGTRAAGASRGLLAAVRPAPERDQGHARPGRDRGQHPARRTAGRSRSRSPTALYEEARQARLDTEKFMLDGRHTGTGGGNHVVVGGATPADSPFLRRPDLLRSLVTYWQNHPSLSLPVLGPVHRPDQPGAARSTRRATTSSTSWRSRSSRSPIRAVGTCPPWLVDRIFRNLLIDVTGNTHRAEICIDKLYSPDGPTGRLGLVEFRAFEMPPHARMSLAQQLLLRALIAWFWERALSPAAGPLGHRRCTTASCCRTSSGATSRTCSPSSRRAACRSSPTGSRPHFEFRFPLLRRRRPTATSPGAARRRWSRGTCMGEEGAIGGTARYVDSSLERLQVKAMSLEGERFAVTCNGRAPAAAADRRARRAVAGVRFRAWQPPACLHPTIGVARRRCVFDLVDRWSGRSMGGCTLSRDASGRPQLRVLPGQRAGGRGPAPRALRAASATRRARCGSSRPSRIPEFPHTLDLRRFG